MSWPVLRTRRHWLEHSRFLVLAIGGDQAGMVTYLRIEGRVLHSQRTEKPVLRKGIKGHPAHHLDNAPGSIDAALAVVPLFSGLKLHWGGEPKRHQIGERFGLSRRRAGRLAQSGGMREDLLDAEIGWFA